MDFLLKKKKKKKTRKMTFKWKLIFSFDYFQEGWLLWIWKLFSLFQKSLWNCFLKRIKLEKEQFSHVFAWKTYSTNPFMIIRTRFWIRQLVFFSNLPQKKKTNKNMIWKWIIIEIQNMVILKSYFEKTIKKNAIFLIKFLEHA